MNTTYILISLISFVTGGIFGVGLMCAMQVNRLDKSVVAEDVSPEIGGNKCM